MTIIDDLIQEALEPFPHALWAACSLDFSPFAGQYAYAVSIIIPHREIINSGNYNELRIMNALREAGEDKRIIEKRLSQIMDQNGIDWINPDTQTDENFIVPLSAKRVAATAGLGWIGKNALFVTPQYGPRIHILTIALNGNISVGAPVMESRCGECRICVDKCMFHVLKGKDWQIDGSVSRDEMVDYRTCRNKREAFRSSLGRRLSCARCIAYCPVGAML